MATGTTGNTSVNPVVDAEYTGAREHNADVGQDLSATNANGNVTQSEGI